MLQPWDMTTPDLKAEMKKSLELLRTLRDEVRVQMHLGGLEAKRRWNELEPRLEQVEQAAREMTEASRAAVGDAVKSLKELRDSLRHS
jgi:hypothetical protein